MALGALMTGGCTLLSASPEIDYRSGTPDGSPTDAATDGRAGDGGGTDGDASDAGDAGDGSTMSCTPPTADCDGDPANGCEANLEESPSHCGGCNEACGSDHGTPACARGTCTIVCDPGFEDCDEDSGNGCEVELATDLEHCGSCGAVCAPRHATAQCNAGECVIGKCETLFDDCDGDSSNGCETLLTSLSDCGKCGVACNIPNGTASCATGVCEQTACAAGFSDCDNDPTTACQSLRQLSNCGGCGVKCDLAHATESCDMGSCTLKQCDRGWGSCDNDPGNGCETHLASLSHCKRCGTACKLTNAVASCVVGECKIANCKVGYLDCDRKASNGCERSVTAPLVPAGCPRLECSSNSDCAFCAFPLAPSRPDECYCKGCTRVSLSKSRCAANEQAWRRQGCDTKCARVTKPCLPSIGLVTHPVCTDGWCTSRGLVALPVNP